MHIKNLKKTQHKSIINFFHSKILIQNLPSLFQFSSTNMSVTDNTVKVDFRYFISLALDNKFAWRLLPSILNDFSPTLENAKEVIDVLIKELKKLHFKLTQISELKKEETPDIEIIDIDHEEPIGESHGNINEASHDESKKETHEVFNEESNENFNIENNKKFNDENNEVSNKQSHEEYKESHEEYKENIEDSNEENEETQADFNEESHESNTEVEKYQNTSNDDSESLQSDHSDDFSIYESSTENVTELTDDITIQTSAFQEKNLIVDGQRFHDENEEYEASNRLCTFVGSNSDEINFEVEKTSGNDNQAPNDKPHNEVGIESVERTDSDISMIVPRKDIANMTENLSV